MRQTSADAPLVLEAIQLNLLFLLRWLHSCCYSGPEKVEERGVNAHPAAVQDPPFATRRYRSSQVHATFSSVDCYTLSVCMFGYTGSV